MKTEQIKHEYMDYHQVKKVLVFIMLEFQDGANVFAIASSVMEAYNTSLNYTLALIKTARSLMAEIPPTNKEAA